MHLPIQRKEIYIMKDFLVTGYSIYIRLYTQKIIQCYTIQEAQRKAKYYFDEVISIEPY